jgi:SSS family solute:Na+ symporter
LIIITQSIGSRKGKSLGFGKGQILSVFAFGLLVRRAPAVCGVAGLLTNVVSYGFLKLAVPEIQFLNRMAVCFALCIALMAVITWLRPLAKPFEFQRRGTVALETCKKARLAGIAVIVLTLTFYFLFSPLGLIR